MDPLEANRAQIEQGDHEGAKRALGAFVRTNPGSIRAWALLASVVSDPVRQTDCYRRILSLDSENTEAADALRRLTVTLQQNGESLRCPQCGGRMVAHFVGALKDKRATCQHCGTEIDLLDAYQRVEHQREQERYPTHTRAVDRTVIETRSDFPGDSRHSVYVRETLIIGPHSGSEQDDDQCLLTPEEVIEAAGGPLPPHERHKRPECGATISRQAPRCEWCGIWFQDQDPA